MAYRLLVSVDVDSFHTSSTPRTRRFLYCFKTSNLSLTEANVMQLIIINCSLHANAYI
ncbi:hypothetical protein ES332_D08G252300v1 [Gossypium tomentosum]|uniref:Uncharacterized protein n=1 Tax=Gossypium tomentosum TaxID=34277 RepID=A0A5D2JZA8_GOSTO|nr:hypothetical protein ES332_D08G252300v1 [Gossypium tomentosum]